MYLIKNAYLSLSKNKTRNLLMIILLLSISFVCTVTLAIQNTANKLIDEYHTSHELIATITFNRENMMNNFKGGSVEENIETFNQLETFTKEDIINYGNSEYVKSYYYTYSTSLNSNTITKASDSYELEHETTTTTPPPGGFKGGNFNQGSTTTITKEKETIRNNRFMDGDFNITGYSDYDSMQEFIEGKYTITEGSIIDNFDEYQCVIHSELASLNDLNVGDTIELNKNDHSYNFVITGIYTSKEENETMSMFSNEANTIITSSNIVENIISNDDTLVSNITPSFILKQDTDVSKFQQELYDLGLSTTYAIQDNSNEIASAIQPIQNVATFTKTFLYIALGIGTIVLFIITLFNIHERKYEIGVYRAIGLSKLKLSFQFLVEMLILSIIGFSIGLAISSHYTKDISNYLLQNEIEEARNESNTIKENFGRPDMDNPMLNQEQIYTTLDASLDQDVLIKLAGIGILLTIVSSSTALISIQRFSPLTILKERN